ncbi:MAG: amino acid adenylation domain-containing protein [Clostridia bacterium]|nr:amino acid adenylation domain-containing protein [Clostridia bacterium]
MSKNMYALTNPQKSIWLTEQFYKGTSIENITGTVIVSQNVDFDALKKAINLFVKNNDSFRLKFTVKDGTVMQYVDTFTEFNIEKISVQTDKDVKNLERKMCDTVFNTLENFLFDFKLFEFPNGNGGFVINAHHLIADAWTAGLVVNEIMGYYETLIKNEELSNEPIPSYIDYINSEKEYLNSEKFKKDKTFWNELFDTIPEVATIPSVKQETKEINCSAKRKLFTIPKETVDLINEFCKTKKASIFNFFMGVLSIYLSRVSGLDEFVIGTPILNRGNFKEKQTTGMYISTIPFKVSVNSEDLFGDFLTNISVDFLKIFRHQKYPYQYLLEDLRSKDSSIPNLYKLLISYQNVRSNKQSSDVLYDSRWIGNNNISDDINIHLYDMNDTGSLSIAYDYLLSKYTIDDICSIHARLLHIINQILENNEIKLKDIEIVTPDELNKILYDFNNTKADYPKDKTITEAFEEQVEKTPDNVAIVFENEQLTYKELNEKANSLAYYLRNNGIGRSDIVGIMVNRSLEMIVSILAVLKSGACYIPIDPEYPQDRIEYMLSNSNAKMLLTFKKLDYKVNFENKLFVELNNELYNSHKKNLENINEPDDLSYIIYTSGSTGMPKGVMLSHKNVNNFIAGMTDIINFSANKTIVSVTTISFDIFVLESLLPLQKGLKIIIANEKEQTNVSLFNKLCIENDVNIIQTTPSRFQFLISDSSNLDYFNNITDILVGGEPFPKLLLTQLKTLSSANIYNVYGPTETTVWSTVKNLSNSTYITIGTPIYNTICYIFDKNKNMLPIFTPGNLYIGGDGVSSGYYNNTSLTAQKFIDNKYVNGKIYDTGDLAYYTDTGDLVHLGRTDLQVKVNGHRIELEEIENKIISLDKIDKCIVTKNCLNDNHEFLCAYFISSDNIDINTIRNHLTKVLPLYMIPQYFIKLDAFPYTPNGKIDRKKLPMPNVEIPNKEIFLPRNSTDELLINLLSELLNIENISIEDSFFELGGDSLTAINLCTKIYSEFNVQIFVKDILENPVIKDLSDYLYSKDSNNIDNTIYKANKASYYAASSAQTRTYYASNIAGPSSTLYNISGGLILDKMPNTSKLQNAFNKLLQRHSALRTHFEVQDNKVVQKVEDSLNFKLSSDSNAIEEKQIKSVFNEFVKPFDLSKAPLFRAKIVKLDNEKAFLMIDMHHIISDGTSLSILVNDVCKLYNDEELPALKIDYKDYAVWENTKINNGDLKESEDYWLNKFKSEVPVLNLPTKTRPAVQSFEGDKVYSEIDKLTTEKLNVLAKNLGITPYMILLSAYYILLSRYTSQEDIVVGTPIVNRDSSELYNIVGMFVNSLPLRATIDSTLSFKTFLNQIKDICLESYKHQNYPFDELVNKLNLTRDTSRSPLFDTMFIYQNNGYSPVSFNGINAEYYIPNLKISKFDLSLEIVPNDEKLSLSFEYATKLFDESFIKNLSNHYINILTAILNNIDIKIADICMLSNDEKNKILYNFNNTKVDYPKDKTITEAFEEQVEKTPDNIAIVFENQQLTYKELNEKANSLAYYLRNNGVGRNDIVGIMVNRSLEMIVSILAVLKSGACYIPIDPEYPQDRIEYMLSNSNAKLLLTFKKLEDKVSFENKLFVELNNKSYNSNKSNLENINEPDDLSYIIYTSGSTGMPKGVALKHISIYNLTNYCNNYVEYLKSNTNQSIASITTISFDIFVFETLISLQKGLKVILANEEEQHLPSKLNKMLQKHDIQILQMTPSRMQFFVDNIEECPYLKNLKYVVLAGEPLPNQLLSKLKDLGISKIYNGYGPSETTVFSSLTDVTNQKDINIGKPLYNTQMYILDKFMNPTPIGIPGELYISGDGVGYGYVNNENLTQKSFIKNLFIDNTIMYKTGDLCKFLDNGEIYYLERVDNQVKIRGLRIELGEIEAKMLEYPNILKAKVIKQTIDNREFIAAYYISNKRIKINELRRHLSTSLPKYMVPSYFTPMSEFPYTPNGKIDKKALPIPNGILNSSKEKYVAPKTDLEIRIASIWEKLLNTKPIGINDNFFELGGDSILAMNLNIELLKISDKTTYSDIFNFPTISSLAKKIESNQSDDEIMLEESDNNIFDFSDILNHNLDDSHIYKSSPDNILLTGATGFLGAHILDSYLKTQSGNVYCIVRKEPGITAETKLYDKLNYYFGSKYNDLINKRIFVVTGNITEDGFGLNQEDLFNLANSVDIVINSAARVDHYGKYQDFYNANVKSVKQIINFCSTFNKKFYQISTLSVSGNAFDTSSNIQTIEGTQTFDESSLYIGQNLDNVYIKSKFEAEKLVLHAIQAGLDAYILRMGNLMPRLSDGKFQENILDNAYINRLIAFLKIKKLPNYIEDLYLEFTPIDSASDSIIKLICNSNKINRIFHLFNHNHVYLKPLFKLLNKHGYNFSFVDESEFKNIVKTLINRKKENNNLNVFINDFDKDLHLTYKTDIIIKSDFTISYLKKIKFKWPKISNDYILKFIEIIKRVM